MFVTWDEPKRHINIATHGWDFSDLSLEFLTRAEITPSRDGRFKAVGPFADTVIAVVFKPLGTEAIALISMRHASRKERRKWES